MRLLDAVLGYRRTVVFFVLRMVSSLDPRSCIASVQSVGDDAVIVASDSI